jgi:hypothetical protein
VINDGYSPYTFCLIHNDHHWTLIIINETKLLWRTKQGMEIDNFRLS